MKSANSSAAVSQMQTTLIRRQRPMRLRILVSTLLPGVACAGCRDAQPKTHTASVTPHATADARPAGESMLPVPDGKIWYKKSGTGTGTPLILLHGGPG